MIVSLTVYQIILLCLALLCIAPVAYTHFIARKGEKRNWILAFILLLLPIWWFTPTIYTVTECGKYEETVVIFPKDGYTLGAHFYVVNNTDKRLVLKQIVYGMGPQNDIIHIYPGKIHKRYSHSIDYLFVEPPASIRVVGQSSQEVKLHLDCG